MLLYFDNPIGIQEHSVSALRGVGVPALKVTPAAFMNGRVVDKK